MDSSGDVLPPNSAFTLPKPTQVHLNIDMATVREQSRVLEATEGFAT